MYGLQKIFDEKIEKHIQDIQTNLVKQKFKEYGIVLNKRQLALVLSSETREYHLELTAAQLAAARKATGRDSFDDVQIDFTQGEIDEATGKFSSLLSGAIPKAVDGTAKSLVRLLKKQAQAQWKFSAENEAAFQRKLERRWKKPLQLFDIYITIIKHAARRFAEVYDPSSEEEEAVYDVLIRLHARACQIALEVAKLLKGGFADGAHARWRTLHEVATVALFIQKHGADSAERYLLHEAVETYKAAEQYQRFCSLIGYKPFDKRKMKRFRAEYDAKIARFGKSFKSQYGWAAMALGNRSPTFADLEKDVDLDRLRPYYRMASHNVHANPKGITHRLGLVRWMDNRLDGPTDVGLADPLSGTSLSLLQITGTFLAMMPTLDVLALNAVLLKLHREIGEEAATSNKSTQDYYEKQLLALLQEAEEVVATTTQPVEPSKPRLRSPVKRFRK
jgi:Family of unknown function (DUF5677)